MASAGSTKRRDMAGYPKDECEDTQNMSMAVKLIRAQGEQIRETPAQYVARKYRIRGDADGHNKGTAPGVPE